MNRKITLPALAARKHGGDIIVGVVAYDYQTAAIADRAGVDIVSAGDSVGVNLWGHDSPLEVTLEEMILVGRAVRRGVTNALVSVDIPFGPVQESTASAVRAAIRLAKEARADLVKIDGAASFPEAVAAVTRAGIPVWAQMGITPQTALRHGVSYEETLTGASVPPSLTDDLVAEARVLEKAGAALLDFQNSGPVAGPAVTGAVGIPVIGGAGGGPWLDGRVRLAQTAAGSAAKTLGTAPDSYAHVAQATLDAFTALIADARAGRRVKGDR
ncbi:MAG: 3-methyl-2-oxobutanoate hydroxymethyltransferase [Streptosporangiales bacterium]|jgi:3-methyl-2-oxobutanoate hydroxymethyltransferase|nr:3-methyl-2-oxobutanoate hydroxymethyltransferase [Streptosporangiales bacterium]